MRKYIAQDLMAALRGDSEGEPQEEEKEEEEVLEADYEDPPTPGKNRPYLGKCRIFFGESSKFDKIFLHLLEQSPAVRVFFSFSEANMRERHILCSMCQILIAKCFSPPRVHFFSLQC